MTYEALMFLMQGWQRRRSLKGFRSAVRDPIGEQHSAKMAGHPTTGMLSEGALVCSAVRRKDLIFDRLISPSRMLPYGRNLAELYNCRLISSLDGNRSHDQP